MLTGDKLSQSLKLGRSALISLFIGLLLQKIIICVCLWPHIAV